MARLVPSTVTDRRGFLRAAVAGTVVSAGLASARLSVVLADKPPARTARAVTAGAPQIFVDLDGIEISSSVEHAFHAATKFPDNPVLQGEHEWERKMGGPCGSFVYDSEAKLFKVWYQGVTGDRRGRTHTYGPHTLNYATSTDGVHWRKPDLGIHPFTWKGRTTRKNNIVVPQTYHDGQDHWESVLLDPFDTGGKRRFKAIGWSSHDPHSKTGFCRSPGSCGIWSMTSSDGLRWTHSPEALFHVRPRPGSKDKGPVGDAQSLMIDTQSKRYVAFLRGAGATGGKRIYSTSEDFVNWSPLGIAMEPFGHGSLYNHTGFNYGDSYLGFLTHYYVRPDKVHQLVLRLLTSKDGLHYRLAQPDTKTASPLVGTGSIGEWDRFMVMLTGAPPIRVGNQLHIYYRGYSETHNRGGVKPTDSYYAGANGLATIRVDGFASLAAGFDGGTVTTEPITVPRPPGNRPLALNAKARHHAEITVEALDEQSQPIPGFGRGDCRPMRTDSVAGPMTWKTRPTLDALAGRTIRLRFHLVNARLYSYTIGTIGTKGGTG